ncbi:MAG: DUF2145 domain-containing protein [Comamonadaceae bacterium]|nr:DUF2145 domain-containing protein [Comamonadaceae bacterium]
MSWLNQGGRRSDVVPLLLLWCLLFTAGSALAGRPCDTPQPPKTQTVTRALQLAEKTLKALDASGAQVVVLARAGQDLTRYGLRYSHLGLAYVQPDGAGHTVWRVLHKLNQCGSAVSQIYRQGLGDFFMDDLWRFEAAWVVPTPEVQAKLLALLNDAPRSVLLHHKPYSMVSYVWGLKYQQSNQWAIETMALALAAELRTPAPKRAQAQAWLQANGYQPSVLKIGALTRLGGRVTAANVAFDDHPTEKRFGDRIETVTVDSVFAWLPRAGLTHLPVVTLR